MFDNIKYILKLFISLNQKAMKKLMLIALLGLTLSSNAQYAKKYAPPKGWKSPELYVPVGILVGTFSINNQLGTSVSYDTKASIAITGFATSLATHFIFRKARENKKKRKYERKHKFYL